ncbi:MAG: 2-thiouracil desulfurase family protein [Clostridia bacterium]
MNIIVSACLLGTNCKYSGGNNLTAKVLELMKGHTLIPICPEQLGGLTTPRRPCEINAGDGSEVLNGNARVMNNIGEDLTEQFVKGAQETLNLAKLYDCTSAILKANSPSCGCRVIYDGSFSGKHKEGSGVTAQLLLDNGIIVATENDFEEKLRGLK